MCPNSSTWWLSVMYYIIVSKYSNNFLTTPSAWEKNTRVGSKYFLAMGPHHRAVLTSLGIFHYALTICQTSYLWIIEKFIQVFKHSPNSQASINTEMSNCNLNCNSSCMQFLAAKGRFHICSWTVKPLPFLLKNRH